MANKTVVKCRCVYCNLEWQFTAKSKADAARMTGDAVCGKPSCRDKQTHDTLMKLRGQGLPMPEDWIRVMGESDEANQVRPSEHQ